MHPNRLSVSSDERINCMRGHWKFSAFFEIFRWLVWLSPDVSGVLVVFAMLNGVVERGSARRQLLRVAQMMDI